MSATSVHTLAQHRVDWFLCPAWRRMASSTMASLTARHLFLLLNDALQFDLNGVKRRRKHDILKSVYQFGEFNHLYNEQRESFTNFF
jgi:hypothetical protein